MSEFGENLEDVYFINYIAKCRKFYKDYFKTFLHHEVWINLSVVVGSKGNIIFPTTGSKIGTADKSVGKYTRKLIEINQGFYEFQFVFV